MEMTRNNGQQLTTMTTADYCSDHHCCHHLCLQTFRFGYFIGNDPGIFLTMSFSAFVSCPFVTLSSSSGLRFLSRFLTLIVSHIDNTMSALATAFLDPLVARTARTLVAMTLATTSA